MPGKGVVLVVALVLALAVGASAQFGAPVANASGILASRNTPDPGPPELAAGRPTPTPGGGPPPTATPGGRYTPVPTDDLGPTATPGDPTPTPVSSPDYDYYLTGNSQDVVAATGGGLMLQGGGGDVTAAFQWLIDRSGGGDFVVIRASGADGYNNYVYNFGGVDSVETLVLKNAAASEDPFVLDVLSKAEVLLIAGGDQWNYVNYWKGTALEDAIHSLRDQNVPIGGNSAGLAVMGEFVFSAQNRTVYSNEALSNPYNQYMTLEQDFLTLPYLNGLITDSHFKQRNRMGRLVGFLARIVQDGWAPGARGIGINEQTALVVDTDGLAQVLGAGAVYFLQAPGLPQVCQPGTPLTYQDVSVYRLYSGGSFDLPIWSGSGGTAYEVSANNGGLSSTLGRGVY